MRTYTLAEASKIISNILNCEEKEITAIEFEDGTMRKFNYTVNMTGTPKKCFIDLTSNEAIKKFKKFTDEYLHSIWNKIGIDKPSNHDEVLQYIIEDVVATADHADWHSGDVDIAFRRWIESNAENLA